MTNCREWWSKVINVFLKWPCFYNYFGLTFADKSRKCGRLLGSSGISRWGKTKNTTLSVLLLSAGVIFGCCFSKKYVVLLFILSAVAHSRWMDIQQVTCLGHRISGFAPRKGEISALEIYYFFPWSKKKMPKEKGFFLLSFFLFTSYSLTWVCLPNGAPKPWLLEKSIKPLSRDLIKLCPYTLKLISTFLRIRNKASKKKQNWEFEGAYNWE